MNIIWKIARAELRNLFYSPIAWLVIVSFYVVIAAVFTLSLDVLTRLQDVTLEVRPGWTGFSMGITRLTMSAQCMQVMNLLYLFIPLLTMGIINREISNGTIKLLYSSPVRSVDIVIGKFLALVVLNTVMLLSLLLFFATSWFAVQFPEIKWHLSMLLGLFLLLNTYAAIGIFLSSLTNYQIVAAVLTFAAFFLLSFIGSWWQQYDFFRDISFALTIAGKAENMIMGLITSRDIFYFILLIILFLGFTVIRLKSTQSTISKASLFARYTGLLVVVTLLGYCTSRSGYIGYLDVTKGQNNTITAPMQEVLKELDGSPVEVTLYTNLFGRGVAEGLPQSRNAYLWGFWEKYKRFYPNISFEYVYYYDIKENDSSLFRRYPGKTIEEIKDVFGELLNIRTSIFRAPEEVRQMIDLSQEDLGTVMEVSYKGKKELMRTFGETDIWPHERSVAGTLKRLTRKEDVRVAYVSGNYERNPYGSYNRDYFVHLNDKGNRAAGINAGFDTDTISILNNEIPAGINLLVIADPKSEYSEAEQERITRYLQEGGNAMLLGEPGKQHILNPLIKSLSIYLEQGTVVTPNAHEMPHILSSKVTSRGAAMSDEWAFWHSRKYKTPVEERVKLVGATTLATMDSTSFRIDTILMERSGENIWLKNGKLVVDSAAPVFAAGDLRKDLYVMAISLSRNINGKEQRIVVAGDGDLFSNERFSSNGSGFSFYSWLLYNQYPLYPNRPDDGDNKFTIKNDSAKMIQYILLYTVPVLLLLTSIILLVRRKRK
ncbi:Gldg family protein [Pseudobacter ginsenosidimutans]|uniref:ABC-2 type transport system permease protein n=1 Tax=Pseudobacter ginsenosidimutans TaxID=661488 RepID=A0A4Q7N1K4_9BACT|nr:Gldg family protein [Pseudobacter ginsenosidimutans]QEC43823.1 ABC transporter permease subunit [Pseudobacter ginsenosidimutans]RZS75243.1 ABC-2 type transport system permease protein [Pseudobacter ginsenosidimutans]